MNYSIVNYKLGEISKTNVNCGGYTVVYATETVYSLLMDLKNIENKVDDSSIFDFNKLKTCLNKISSLLIENNKSIDIELYVDLSRRLFLELNDILPETQLSKR